MAYFFQQLAQVILSDEDWVLSVCAWPADRFQHFLTEKDLVVELTDQVLTGACVGLAYAP